MRDEQNYRHQKVKPLFHRQAPALRIEVVWIGLGIIEVLEKDELPPWENKTYMRERISENNQRSDNQKI
jgi:hypothetical protein